jgi:CRISPR-associated protein Cpf1
MRVTDSNYESGTSENDFILSPVEPFFDSRKARTLLPENGDANGAYNIARKGILMLQAINTSETVDKVDLMVKKEQWQNYCQAEQVVKIQLKKLTQ